MARGSIIMNNGAVLAAAAAERGRIRELQVESIEHAIHSLALALAVTVNLHHSDIKA